MNRGTPALKRFSDGIASLVIFGIQLAQDLKERPDERRSDVGRDVFSLRLGAFAPVLHGMILTRGVDDFLIYLSELFGLIFRTEPGTLRSGEKIAIEEVLQHESLDEVVAYLANRRAERLAYAGLRAIAAELENDLGFELFQENDLDRAVQVVGARNLVVHNRGVINAMYLRRVPDGGVPEERLPIDGAFVLGSLDFLAAASRGIDGRAVAKFILPTDDFSPLPPDVQTVLADKQWPSEHRELQDFERSGD